MSKRNTFTFVIQAMREEMKLAIALAFWRYGITALRHYGITAKSVLKIASPAHNI
ncbi:hypothetical protein [Kosakonia sacchari]|uniref:hypothetical protein n=1 Tax=Kosakonia sacchari TaxID=1158459 RepID=UPI003F56C972